MRSKLGQYIWNVLISIDQFVNAIMGGDPDETISSRVSKHRTDWWARPIFRFLEWLDPGHGDRSKEEDEGENDLIDHEH